MAGTSPAMTRESLVRYPPIADAATALRKSHAGRTSSCSGGTLVDVLDLFRPAAMDALGERRFHEIVEVAVENLVGRA